MPRYKFWYKNEVLAENMDVAMKKERKIKPTLSSVEKIEDEMKELTPLIGFSIETDSLED